MSARAALVASLAAVAAALAGCADGRSLVTLTVTADAPIANIDRLHIVATDDARQRSANPVEVAVAGHSVPPDVTVPLAAPSSLKGGLTLAVTALATDGSTVAVGTTDVTIAPSKTFTASVKLTPMLHRALSFVVQPASAKPDQTLTTVQVAILDDAGNTLTDATDVVSLTLAGGAGSAVLSGHVRVAAVAGVASFPDLSINLAGAGYTLAAATPMADAATSASFDITPDIWVPANGGLDGGSMEKLFFDPNDANSVWAFSFSGAGLWHTKDGGASWAQYGSTLPGNAWAGGAVSPTNADTIFMAGLDKALRRSDDGGASWDVVGAGLPPPTYAAAIFVAPNDDKTVYATVVGVLYRSTDRGDNFTSISTPAATGSFTIDPANPSTLYMVGAGSTSAAIYKSTDAGASWNVASTGLPSKGLRIFSIDKATGTLWAGATVTSPSSVTTIYQSTDGAAHWTAVGMPAPTQVNTLVPVAGNPMRFFAGGYPVGLLRSDDGGATWQTVAAVNVGDQQPGFASHDAAGNVWLLPAEGQPYKSTDHNTFAAAGHGISALQVHSVSLGSFWFIGVDGRGIFRSAAATSWQSASTGFGLGDSGTNTVEGGLPSSFALQDEGTLYHSTDGTNWTVVAPFTSMDQFFGFDAAGDTIVAVEGGNIVTSTNAGAMWSQRTTNAALAQPIVRVDPTNTMIAYIADVGYLSKTTDGGMTFNDVQPSAAKPRYSAMAMDPTATATLYVASATSQLFKTVNGGGAWSTVGSGLPTSDNVRALAIDQTAPMTIYAVTQASALYKSKDGGATFKQIRAPKGLYTVVADRSQSGRVVAGTSLGVWLTTTGGE